MSTPILTPSEIEAAEAFFNDVVLTTSLFQKTP